MAVSMLEPAGSFPAAGLGRRLASAFYDMWLCLALMMTLTLIYQQGILRLIYGSEALKTLSDAGALDRDPILSLILLAGLLGFFGLFWSKKGQTLGMQVWRVRLQQPDGRSISLRQAFIRFVVAVPAWLCGGLGIIWIFFDAQSRSWQDIASGTQLVTLPKGTFK